MYRSSVVFGAMWVLVVSSNAATITWNSPTPILSASDISTDGELVEAFNAAITGDTEGSQTVNGVQFVRTQNLLSGDFDSEQPSPLFPTDTGDFGYNSLLNSIDFAKSSEGVVIGGNNLEVGRTYQVQLWYVDQRSHAPQFSQRRMAFGDENGASSAPMNGQFIIGTFTADSSSQILWCDVVTSNNSDSHLNAYQLRLIPEPSSALLLALSLFGCFRRQRSQG